jgi:hypothetical protein
LKKLLNIKGQISIFFATTILVLITFIAFIVNIGIFVKAKMNLQNAVDAAAYAGAAVQARQLTNIAYLNWEMRNIYKEWIFKQYILGNLNLDAIVDGAAGTTDLTMKPYNSGTGDVMDSYNIPSACVDFRASGNVSSCSRAMVPGLPRFPSTNVLGLERTMDTFMDAIGGEKSKQCSQRTKINYLSAFVWAYNVPGSGATQVEDAPDVLTDRPGAFPTALETAFRMRQLEAQVNKKPYEQGVCIGTGVNCGDGDINALIAGDLTPSNERVYKAFYSGFRNLGSTNCDSEAADELKCFFTLSELPPTVPSQLGSEQSLSNILIPPGPARDKYYLDLKLQSVNYASFYTMLAPNTVAIGETGSFVTSGVAAESTAECVSTKVGIPVPGYPLGFVKSPDVITYYAVKGQSRFIGRFSPFANNSLTLTAYAAAKPFGGRIGPMIFDANVTNAESLRPRMNDQGMSKSSPYLTGIENSKLVNRFGDFLTEPGVYSPGVPIPLGLGDERFFVMDENDVIGGNNAAAPLRIFFSIPNIVYDYPGTSPNDFNSYGSDDAIQIYDPTAPLDVKAGLYNGAIFNKLRANLTGVGGATITVNDISNGVYKARSPTLYDSHHYLVPTPEDINQQLAVDSYGYVTKRVGQIEGRNLYDLILYAPLMSDNPDSLYKSVSELVQMANRYLESQERAILKYRGSMNQAAWAIRNNNRSSRTARDVGFEASQIISSVEPSLLDSADKFTIKDAAPGCDSVTGAFVYFFIGTGISGNNAVRPIGCDPQNRLINMLEVKWAAMEGEETSRYYIEKYLEPEDDAVKKALFSAYRPTPMNDADDQGVFKNITNNSNMNMWRNSYSTKFVTLKSLSNRDENFYQSSNFSIFSEGSMTQGVEAIRPKVNFSNILTIPPQSDFSRIRH